MQCRAYGHYDKGCSLAICLVLMGPGTLYMALCYHERSGDFLWKEQFKLNGKETEPSTHKAQSWGEEDGALGSKHKDCTDQSHAEDTVVARAHMMWSRERKGRDTFLGLEWHSYKD